MQAYEVTHLNASDLIAAARGLASESTVYRAMRRANRERIGRGVHVITVEAARRELGDLVTERAIQRARERAGAA